MGDLLKLIWELFALRDSMQKGEMTPGVWAGAAAFLFALCCIGIPTIVYSDRHPDASPRFLIAPGIGLVVLMVVYFFLAIRWRMRLRRERAKQDVKPAA